ncbi:MAG TPA: hypothetical protein EYH43_04525 [Persephonella sp.]|nr:hypothetical protein [Hydrogenothermaceae bacterium]HIQ25230.1 hypothetical protein [Persephonella sp.]
MEKQTYGLNPEKLPTVGEWFSDNIGLLIGMIIFFSVLVFGVWTILDKEKKSGFWTKFLTSLTVGFFITTLFFVYKVVIIGLSRL